RDDGGLRRLLTSMAELFVRGVALDWTGVLPAQAGRVDLPTYAFDHEHYWLHTTGAATDAPSLGLAGADHPLLGAVVRLPHTDGLVFTSRLSLRTHPWLADHAVSGVVIVPGTGLVELAVRAGDEAGCAVLDELVIQAPLVVPERGAVRVQVAVGGPDGAGSRTVDVYSQREDDDTWTRHATGVLSTEVRPAPRAGFDFAAWPPPGAEPVEVDGGYQVLAESGYGYGPSFRGVRALWRRDDEVFAEVALPEDHAAAAAGFGLHPALLDAALHCTMLNAVAVARAADGEARGELTLPFAWNGLRLHAAGASALRVRVGKPEPGSLSLEAVDAAGGLVVTMDSLVGRAVTAEQLATAAGTGRTDSLFGVDWAELARVEAADPPAWLPVATAEEVATLADDVETGAVPAPALAVMTAVSDDGDALDLTTRVLDVVQCWLAGAGLEDTRLLVATRGAVAAGDGAVTDPAASAVWGLVRAAQAENPDRVLLLDADSDVEPLLGAVLASGEPQIAVRGGAFSVPRLARVAATAPATAFGPDGTVLVTGGTGSLGGLVARHLATRHGVRRLVLASRRGPAAEGADKLVAELAELGAAAAVVACDVADRDQVAALLAEHRPAAVVHTAGVTDDGVIGTLTRERLARVFAPKVDAVRHLDELTRDMDLGAFVVYSSVSGVFMGAGSGSYAAANAYLDGLMAARRAAGLPGVSLAWGLWEQTTGMAADIDELTRTRMSRRGGLLAITPAEGMDLFDAAVGSGQPHLVPAKLDLREVRARAAAGGEVPHLLRGLVRAGRQQARAAGAGDDRRLADRLAGLTGAEQAALLLDLVRAQVAAVLGHGPDHHLDPDQGLFEIGFDSLTAIELRNRLRDLTERKLAPSTVFDHPTPGMLAAHLHRSVCGDHAADPVAISV
uniref:type I polyketide synthase n=1 Tax=Actinokineospora pegani TaxID=2654637 RepID=UPI0012E9F5FE